MVVKVDKIHPFERIGEWNVKKIDKFVNIPFWHDLIDGVSLDVEDDEQGNFVGLGIYVPDTKRCYYWSSFELIKLIRIPRFVAHNGASDIAKLRKWGFKIDESWLLWDTQLMAHILDSSRKNYGLKKLVKEDLGFEYPSYEEICGKKASKNHKTLADFHSDQVAEYNFCDTYYTYKLYEKQRERLTVAGNTTQWYKEQNYFSSLEKPVSSIFKKMEDKGIRVDLKYLVELKDHLEDQKDPIETEIKNALGNINLNSPKQLLEALHAKDITPTFKGKASTDKRALERIRNVGVVSALLRFSELDTLLSSFIAPYLERAQEIVHPYFNQCGTRTGRVSCSNPNLLQIPKRTDNGKLVRRMFIPREGFIFGDCDYGQIEPRILAHFSEDESLCEMFNQGVDFHSYTADELQIGREKAKILNLSVGYRATFVSVSRQLGCTEKEAQDEIDRWWSMFPELRLWQDKLVYETKKSGYCTTLLGRRIKVEGLNEYNKWKRESAQRQLINNLIQGSAAEIMKLAMIAVNKLNMVDILVQIYDELLFEFPDNSDSNGTVIRKVQAAMENCTKLNVPLVVDAHCGSNWGEIA